MCLDAGGCHLGLLVVPVAPPRTGPTLAGRGVDCTRLFDDVSDEQTPSVSIEADRLQVAMILL